MGGLVWFDADHTLAQHASLHIVVYAVSAMVVAAHCAILARDELAGAPAVADGAGWMGGTHSDRFGDDGFA